ncbi:hypothetical protein LB543_05585 [Mesorhizobium sp. ESP7-2]|uniref:hypothetical protein n=1 Tax=Mesorhizobium sp. ESP7-2 TaxID=2876622 RepID=UPI001CCAB6FE|nr:hypothetical protein [Mesorhizobium sp. ESP7-2]MBZ9706190.1 hypothetical protein [Mesorhizobium sp. ESP7-2]
MPGCTAGIGEHAPLIRHEICASAAWLGVELDDDWNRKGARSVSARHSRVDILVVPADEEQPVARALNTV